MDIHSDTYDLIYELVADKFFQELPVERRKKYMSMVPLLWDENINGEYIVGKIIAKHSKESRYILRERGRIRSDSEKRGISDIKDAFLISLLKYLGLDVPTSKLQQSVSIKENEKLKAKMLFQLFLEKYLPDYLLANPELIIIDTPIIKDANKSDVPHTGVALNADDTIAVTGELMAHKKAIHDIIGKYYQFLASGNLKEAIKLYLPHKQQSSFQNFDLKYIYTDGVNHLKIMDMHFKLDTPEKAYADCSIFYVEQVVAKVRDILNEAFEEKPEHPSTENTLIDISKVAEKHDIKEFNQLTRHDFANGTAIEKLSKQYGDRFNDLLEAQVKRNIHRLYRIKLEHTKNGWLIDSFEPLKLNQSYAVKSAIDINTNL